MLKGEDIVLLLKLSDSPPDWTVRTLAEETSIPRSVVHRALKRLAAAGLLDEHRRRVNASQAEEFLVHGLRTSSQPSSRAKVAAYQRPGPPRRWPGGSPPRRANCRPFSPTLAPRAVALPCAPCTTRSPRRPAETHGSASDWH